MIHKMCPDFLLFCCFRLKLTFESIKKLGSASIVFSFTLLYFFSFLCSNVLLFFFVLHFVILSCHFLYVVGCYIVVLFLVIIAITLGHHCLCSFCCSSLLFITLFVLLFITLFIFLFVIIFIHVHVCQPTQHFVHPLVLIIIPMHTFV